MEGEGQLPLGQISHAAQSSQRPGQVERGHEPMVEEISSGPGGVVRSVHGTFGGGQPTLLDAQALPTMLGNA